MLAEKGEGFVGNLLPEQETKLREIWQLIMAILGVYEAIGLKPGQLSSLNGEMSPEQIASMRRGFENASATEKSGGDSEAVKAAINEILAGDDQANSKFDLPKVFQHFVETTSPRQFREAFWALTKHDHPDALLLRFLRARKWNVRAALVMAVAALHWRSVEYQVDTDISLRGEQWGVVDGAESAESKNCKDATDFVEILHKGQSFMCGRDRDGRPVIYVRVRLHKIGQVSQRSLERYTIFMFETIRLMLKPPIETVTIIFDLQGFSLANADYSAIKFVIKCFEANYPESLGNVLVHKAPRIFEVVWRGIRRWIDPVVASKIHFVNNVQELSTFVDPEQLITEVGGSNPWEYHYIDAQPDENSAMANKKAREEVEKARYELATDYENVIAQWCLDGQVDSAKQAAYAKKRYDIYLQMRDNYWDLDKYIRARSMYDRMGLI